MKIETQEEKQNKEDLLSDIKKMKTGSFEQMFLVTTYSLSNYLKCLMTFGRNSQVTRDNLNIIKEMFSILKTERTLLNYILRNLDKMDVYSALLVVGLLDETNDETVNFYYKVMDDIEEACELEDEIRGKRIKQRRPTLIQDQSYAAEVIALCENTESLKSFLGYEDAFWAFLADRIKIVDTDPSLEEKMIYATPIYDEDHKVATIDLLVPRIVDLETALMALQLYVKAYGIYKSLGQEYVPVSQEEIASLATSYQTDYLQNKAIQTLHLKNVNQG